jgi:hypothetical protein
MPSNSTADWGANEFPPSDAHMMDERTDSGRCPFSAPGNSTGKEFSERVCARFNFLLTLR